jgi:hypothetical protein
MAIDGGFCALVGRAKPAIGEEMRITDFKMKIAGFSLAALNS